MIGMLWFDNDPKKDPQAKIAGAVDYYEKKYGQAPNICFVHPSTLPASPVPASELEAIYFGRVELRTSKAIMPNHFWIGVAESIGVKQLQLKIK